MGKGESRRQGSPGKAEADLSRDRALLARSEGAHYPAGGRTTRDARRMKKLLEIAEQINSELDVEKVLGLAGKRIIELFEAGRVFIVEMAPNGDKYYRLAVSFRGRKIEHPQLEVSQGVLSSVADKREPILVTDASSDDYLAERSSIRDLDLHSIMAVPLVAKGDFMGVAYADNHLVPGAFDEESLDLLALLANHVAVALRNAELFEKLTRTREELAISERQKGIGQLATFLAHEMKTPLATLKLLSESIEDSWDDEKFRRVAPNALADSVERLDKLTRRILEHARPTALHRINLKVSEVVDGAISELLPQIERERVCVTRRPLPEEPFVWADPIRLREVFTNLIKNGIEAMKDSERREILVTLNRAGTGELRVAVADTGAGVPPERLGSIFDVFVSAKEGGTGLGLAYARKLISEHAGTIQASNNEGGGATFTISLPTAGH